MTAIEKILVIRFSSIGDIVLTTPVIRALRKKYPDAQIDYLTKQGFQPVLQGNPHISRIITINKHVREVLQDLKEENYDFIVDLHKNFRSHRVRSGLQKPGGSFDKLNVKKWLLVNFRVKSMPDIHIVDRYFQAAARLGVINDNQGLDYYIPEEETFNPGDLPSSHRNGFIAFVVGGKHQTKMMPEEKVISICRKLARPIVLLGGQEDHATGVRIQRAVGDRVFNACGFYSINQSASILQQAEKVITNDTGLMHIAAAFNKPVISVWGSTVPEFGMYPYMPKHPERSTIVEVKGLSCRPCSKIGFSRCPKKHFKCMMDIPEEEVLKKLSL